MIELKDEETNLTLGFINISEKQNKIEKQGDSNNILIYEKKIEEENIKIYFQNKNLKKVETKKTIYLKLKKKESKQRRSISNPKKENSFLNSNLEKEKIFPKKDDFKKMVNQSLESLKVVGKIFSLKSPKKNFIKNSIERLKNNIAQKNNKKKNLQNFESKLIAHFWNIHEVYLNVIFKSQKKIDDFYEKIFSSCQNISIFNEKLIFEECRNKQKIQYLNDLFFKFANLSVGEKYHDQILGAILNAIELGKASKICFFKNLKYVKS